MTARVDADRRDTIRTAVLLVAAFASIAAVRFPLFQRSVHAHAESDVYELPPPAQVVALSLGYRAALADFIWSHVLVSQGLHMEQHLRYENVPRLIETINELDPTFREPYLFAEALITFQVGQTPVEDTRATRAILERGARERPLDGEVWLTLGEFVAYIAPGTYLTDPTEQARWRVEGAHMLARAAELGGDSAAWQSLGGASILSHAGERGAAIRFLRRTLAVTDDPELQQSVRAHLQRLLGERQTDAFARLDAELLARRHAELPQVSRSLYALLGPPRDPAACAGPERARDVDCMGTWHDWETAVDDTAIDDPLSGGAAPMRDR